MKHEPNLFSLRWYLPGYDQEKAEIRRFFEWLVSRHTLPTRLIITVSGRESVRSWEDPDEEDTSFVWIPDSPSEPAYLRLAFGSYLKPPKLFESWREMMDACIYELSGCAIDYLASFEKDTVSDRIIMNRRSRLMQEWIDYVDNGVCDGNEKIFRQRFFRGCVRRDFSLLRRMGKEGLNLNFSIKGYTPLGLAVEAGDLRLVRFLVGYGANVNAFYSDVTAVHVAAAYGHRAILRFLLEHGGDPTLPDKTYEQMTPLQHALKWNRKGIVRILKEKCGG